MGSPTVTNPRHRGLRLAVACMLSVALSCVAAMPALASANGEAEEDSSPMVSSFNDLEPLQCFINGKLYNEFSYKRTSYLINFKEGTTLPSQPTLQRIPTGWVESETESEDMPKSPQFPHGGVRYVISVSNGDLKRTYEFRYTFYTSSSDGSTSNASLKESTTPNTYKPEVKNDTTKDAEKDEEKDGKTIKDDGRDEGSDVTKSSDYAAAQELYERKLVAVEDAEKQLEVARDELDEARRQLDKARGVETESEQVGSADTVSDAPTVSNLTVSFPTAIPTVVTGDGTLITPSPESCGIRNLSPFGIHMSALGVETSWPFRFVHDGEGDDAADGCEGLLTLLIGSSKERIDMAECHPRRATSSPDKWAVAGNAGDGGNLMPIMVSGRVVSDAGDIGNGRMFGTVTWHIAPDEATSSEAPEADSSEQVEKGSEKDAASEDGESAKTSDKDADESTEKADSKDADKDKSSDKESEAKNQSK